MTPHTIAMRRPFLRTRMNTVLTMAALEIKNLANETRGAEGMLPMAAAQVLEALAGGDASEVSEAVRGWIHEARCANGEGMR